MQKYVTISAKISGSLRQKMKRLGMKPSVVIKKALEEEMKKSQAADIVRSVHRVQRILKKIPMEEVVKGIREDRDNR